MSDAGGGRGQQRRARIVPVACALCLLVALAVAAGAGAGTAADTAGPGADPASGSGSATPLRQDDTPDNATPGSPGAPGNGTVPDSAPDAGEGIGGWNATTPPVPVPEGDVTVDLEEGSLTAGEVGTLAFEVDNDAGGEVTDVIVTLRSYDPAVYFGSPSAPRPTESIYIETLVTADSEIVTVDAGAARVDPGTYPIFASVQYSDEEDDDVTVYAAGPTVAPVEVDDAREFTVTNVTESVPVDDEATYAVRITNEGNETVTDAVAAVEVGPPLSSPSPTAYVGTLDPGESQTVRFALESSEDAIETTDSVAVTLTYDDASNERASTDPIRVPVVIVEEDEEADVESIAPFAAAAAVLVGAAVWWLRRR